MRLAVWGEGTQRFHPLTRKNGVPIFDPQPDERRRKRAAKPLELFHPWLGCQRKRWIRCAWFSFSPLALASLGW